MSDEVDVDVVSSDVTSDFLKELFRSLFGKIDDSFDIIDSNHTEFMERLDSYDSQLISITDELDYLNDRVDIMYQSSLWNMLLLGLISGILFVLVFTGGRK